MSDPGCRLVGVETSAPRRRDIDGASRALWGLLLAAEVSVVWVMTGAHSVWAATLVLALVATALALIPPTRLGWPRYACSTIVAFNGGAFALLTSLAFGAAVQAPGQKVGEADARMMLAIGLSALASAIATGLAQHRADLAAEAKAADRHDELLARVVTEPPTSPPAVAETPRATRWPIVVALVGAAVLGRRRR